MRWILPYWIIPVFGSLTWFGMLWAMLGSWLAKGQPKYPWQDGTIAYISDVGASGLQPLFIAGSAVMSACLIFSVSADRLLRHQNRLAPNFRQTERVLSYCAIASACVAAVGILIVACLNTANHHSWHDAGLVIFIVGLALSAIFIVVEFGYLDNHHHDHERVHGMLRLGYYIKIFVVTIAIAGAIAFGILNDKSAAYFNAAAIMEWFIAFWVTFYFASFAIDLWPATAAPRDEYLPERDYTGVPKQQIAHGIDPETGALSAPTAMEIGVGKEDARRVDPNATGLVGVRHYDEKRDSQATAV